MINTNINWKETSKAANGLQKICPKVEQGSNIRWTLRPRLLKRKTTMNKPLILT